jgi:hypothetical protein
LNVVENLQGATRVTMRPGDFVLIPAHTAHVLHNSEPSAFIGISIFPVDRASLVREAVRAVLDSGSAPDAELWADERELDEGIGMLIDGLSSESTRQRVEAMVSVRRAALRSTGFAGVTRAATTNTIAFQSNSRVRTTFSGSVQQVSLGGSTVLFARGEQIVLQHPVSREARSALASDAGATLESLRNELLREELDLLLRSGSVVACSPEEI